MAHWRHLKVSNCSTERVIKGVSSNCPIRTGRGVDECGRNSTARRRVGGERPPAFQAQGSIGKHHRRSEASLLLPEAGREAPSEASFGAKACPKKVSQRLRVSCNNWGGCCRAAARERGTMRRIYVSFANIAGLGGDGGAEHRIGCRAGHGCG